MTKKKILDWGMLFFMFLFVMYLGAILIQLFSPQKETEYIKQEYSYECYLPLYFYDGFGNKEENYSSYLCRNEMGKFSIVRIFKSIPITISYNSISDIIWFITVFLLGVVSWVRYLKIYLLDSWIIWFITRRSS